MDKVQLKALKDAGQEPPMWAMIDGRTVPRATFYNKDGVEMVNLPADPYHLARFLSKGFTLTKPQVAERPEKFVCGTCGKEFGARLALAGHSRSHNKEKEVN